MADSPFSPAPSSVLSRALLKRRLLPVLFLALVAVALAGCASRSVGTSTTRAAVATTLAVTTSPSSGTRSTEEAPVTTEPPATTARPRTTSSAASPQRSFLPYGDSKTVGWGDETKNGGYPPILASLISTSETTWKAAKRIAVGGITVAAMRARIDADLAGRTDSPDIVLFNLGTNDVGVGRPHVDPAVWKAEVLYVLDAMKAKWPKVAVYIARIYRSDQNGDVAALDDKWIPAVVAARPGWVHLGIDERAFLPGPGKLYVRDDGLHPNHAGYVKTAEAWRAALGL
jgi:lysophospholipase L1-like esterase